MHNCSHRAEYRIPWLDMSPFYTRLGSDLDNSISLSQLLKQTPGGRQVIPRLKEEPNEYNSHPDISSSFPSSALSLNPNTFPDSRPRKTRVSFDVQVFYSATGLDFSFSRTSSWHFLNLNIQQISWMPKCEWKAVLRIPKYLLKMSRRYHWGSAPRNPIHFNSMSWSGDTVLDFALLFVIVVIRLSNDELRDILCYMTGDMPWIRHVLHQLTSSSVYSIHRNSERHYQEIYLR